MNSATPRAIDSHDVQGLVRFAHAHLTEASFLLLTVEDPVKARRWLANAKVTTSEKLPVKPQTVVQIALTFPGLASLGLHDSILRQFPAEFISGIAGEESRSRRLGDVDQNAPENWEWGSPQKTPHIIVMAYASSGLLAELEKQITGELTESGLRRLEILRTSDLGGVEQFGFTDGISQPAMDWDGTLEPSTSRSVKYNNLSARGEFLLGHINEYGKYTDRPLIGRELDPDDLLAVAPDQPAMKDLGFNGSYVVLRQLEQDVIGFWQFLNQAAGGNADLRRQLAEKIVGRRMKGEPLVPLDPAGSAGIPIGSKNAGLNQFTYLHDPAGVACPFGAHIRRANPRNTDYPPPVKTWWDRLLRTLGVNHPRADLLSSVRFHRILRRGREYGPGLSVEDAALGLDPASQQRGLHFIAINANIARQFEFIQSAWVNSDKFQGLRREMDPLIGARHPLERHPEAKLFSMPQLSGPPKKIDGLPAFVRVRGAAYFFLPSIRALKYLGSIRSKA